MNRKDFTPGPEKDHSFNIKSKERNYDGFFKIDKYELNHRLYNGSMSDYLVREVFERGHAVAVLPYDAKEDKLILLEQFRIGAMAAGQNPWLIEIVAGMIDEGETRENVAVRELKEEAGCDSEALEHICDFLVSPGGTTENITLYAALVDSTKAAELAGLDHEGEDIKVHVIPASKALEFLDQGKITNATALIALQWFKNNHQNLRKKWSQLK